jgi:WD40 repeat protein/ABC-type dipeptide/oligopeptide/nickel transport system ATPase subunit
MVERKNSRRRGATLTGSGYQKLQAARREAEESANFGDRYTKEELSRLTGLSLKTISKIFDGAPAILAQRSIPVDKQTLDLCFAAFNLSLDRGDYIYPDGMIQEIDSINDPADLEHRQSTTDWGEAPDVSVFYGRVEELTRLSNWVDEDCCKLVVLLGMGGIGKTTLVTKLAQQLQPHFTTIVWRSLRNAPQIETLIPQLIKILSHQTEAIAPTIDISTQISHLLDYLRQQRCLLVFDNAEAIIPSHNIADSHGDRYPGYAELFERIGASSHQSCLLVTSREKPEAIVSLEGEKLPVRTLIISGLNVSESEALFDAKGLSASTADRDRLQKIYSGNPLALNIVSTSIADLFDGEIDKFLDTEVSIFSGIRQLLDRQFDRLSPTEQAVMYCLAIERSWVSIADLHERIIPTIAKSSLLSTLESLKRRSLIEHGRGKFTQQAVVMEYMTARTIDRVVNELTNWDIQGAEIQDLPLWFSYPLMAAESPKYIHAIQKRLVLEPIVNRLQSQFGHKLGLAQHLQSIVASLQKNDRGILNYGAGNLINLLRHLDIDLTGSNFANLPIWQVNFQNTLLHNVNFSGADLTNSTFSYSSGGIYAIAFHPESHMAAAGEYNGNIYLVKIDTKKIYFKLQGHTNWIWSLAFSPDGQILASACQDGTIRLWDLVTGQVRHILQADNYRVLSLSFSPKRVNQPSGEAYILATAHGDGAIRWWNVSTGKLISEGARHPKTVYSVRFSPDGKFLATGSDDATVKIWDAETGDCLHTLTEHTNRVWSVRFSPDGRLLVTCSGDGTIRLWDVATWNCFEVLTGYRNWFFAIDFSPDSQMLAVANVGNVVKVWNVRTKQHLAILSKHNTWVSTLNFSPNGKFLGTASGDGAVRLWDTTTWQELYHWQGYSNLVESVMFDPTGTKLLTGSQDGMLREWDAQTQTILQTFPAHQVSVWSIDYSRDGRFIVSGSADSTVKLWDAETGDLLQTFSAQSGDVWSVKFSPDGRFIAGVTLDNTGVCLWLLTGELCGTFIGHTHLVRSIAFSPDSQFLATASFDACWRLWDVKTRQMVGCYPGHTNWIFDLAFSPDGRSIATCSVDLTVRRWDVATGNLLQTFEGHTLEVHTVKFSPNGQYLATGSSDRSIKIWDIGTGKIFQTLTGHLDRVLSVSYSPDGKLLVSSSGDGTIKLWDLTTNKCTASWKPLPLYAGLNITRATGLTPATTASLKSLGAIEL